MARTLAGNYTGRAAVIDRQERLMAAFEGSFGHRWQSAIDRLQEIDPDGWAEWYDGRPEQTCGEMLPLILERIAEMEQR